MGSFQDLLNRIRTINMPGVSMPEPEVPSQMPGAYKMGIDHGIAGDLSDIQQMPYRYGDQGGIQQMPYRGGTPTLTEFGQGIKALKKGKERGVMNDSTYEALQMEKLLKFILYLICLQNNFFSCIPINT
jgi:hypothetical protein